jgi:hypothetical protein
LKRADDGNAQSSRLCNLESTRVKLLTLYRRRVHCAASTDFYRSKDFNAGADVPPEARHAVEPWS